MASLALGLLLTQTAWKPYTVDGFKISLPEVPKSLPQENEKKGVRTYNLAHNGRNQIVMVSAPSNLEANATPDVVLADILSGFASGTKGQLTGQIDLLQRGWPALEARWKGRDTNRYGVGYAVVANGRIFSFMVRGDSEKAIEAPYAKMVASLQLPDGTANGTQTVPGPTFTRHEIKGMKASVEFPSTPKEIPSEDRPQPSTPPTRLISVYGNRLFILVAVELPPEAMEGMDESMTAEALQKFNEEVAVGFGGSVQKSLDTKVDGHYGIRSLGAIANGRGAMRIESTLVAGRLFGFVTVVPDPIKKAPEIDRFFGSVKLGTATG